MRGTLHSEIEVLLRIAPSATITGISSALRSHAADVPLERVIKTLPPIHNPDLARQIQNIVRNAQGRISWEALG